MSEDTAVLKAILSELKKITALPKYKFEEEEEDKSQDLELYSDKTQEETQQNKEYHWFWGKR